MPVKSLLRVVILFSLCPAFGAEVDLNVMMMHYTYALEGPAETDGQTIKGTAFVITVPDAQDPQYGEPALITAATNFEHISGESCTLYLREQTAESAYELHPHALQIRNEGVPLWVRHPSVDVAVISMPFPEFVARQTEMIPSPGASILANDLMAQLWEFHLGDEFFTLGFPLGVSAPGFPLFRSGRVASYPLTPVMSLSSFYLDVQLLPGNNGGPVYFLEENRLYGGQRHPGETIKAIVGMVSGKEASLGLANIVSGQAIQDTIVLYFEQKFAAVNAAGTQTPATP